MANFASTGSLPRGSVVTGARAQVPAAPLPRHIPRCGDRPALVYKDETSSISVSYPELDARTNALARALAARASSTSANKDVDYVIAVCMQRTPNTILTLLATWKAGAAYVPMETSFPQARICHILKDSEPALIVYDDTVTSAMFPEDVPAVSFEELSSEASGLATDELSEEVLSKPEAGSIPVVMYTSGSTGVPKGVRLTYSAICNRLWWQFRVFPYAQDELNCVWKTALTFGDSICEIWGPLLKGKTLVILSQETTRDPQKLVRSLCENQVHRLVLVPTLLDSVLMYLSLNPSEQPLKNLKLWVCSGETLSKRLAGKFFDYFGDHEGFRLANFYGSTELMADVTYYVIENSKQLDVYSTVPIGSPIDNCTVYLLDEEMNSVSELEQGEVWVAGHNLCAGYVRAQCTDKFLDNPHDKHSDFSILYRTGDFGVLQNGVILYAGRKDSQVKIRGHKVDLAEVDKAVIAIPGIDKCVVLCYGLERGSPEILAFVTMEPETRLSAHHIEAELKTQLMHYMMPQVIVIDSIPLLVSGKVDKQALLKMYESNNSNDDSSIPLEIDYSGVEADKMEAARVLFQTVGEVLGRAARGAVCARAGFYELGGNSLNTITTITRLRDKGYYIDISHFIGAANLGEILRHLSTNPHKDTEKIEQTFIVDLLKDEDQPKIVELITGSFYGKAGSKGCLHHETKKADYAHLVIGSWAALIRTALSIVLRDSSGTPVAVALNFDGRDKPEVELTGGLAKVLAFLENLESSVRDTMLPAGKGTIVHAYMMGTDANMSAPENVAAIHALEEATLRVAKERGFRGVFTTNTSLLTQQLGKDILGYQTLLAYQINQYVDPNGDRIFGKAADSMHAIVCWKPVD